MAVVQIVFFAVVILFLATETKKAFGISNPHDRKLLSLLQPILLIGVIARIIFLSHPEGVFVDGAIGGYDSWCLANYGVDSNLASYPVYLKSWGSGQSALYAYLALPFIKLFGLNIEAYRLPMSLIGCTAFLFFYYTLRKTQQNALLIFCLSAFVAINPWHIIKCRFALDCNIFPELLLIGMCFIILAYYSKSRLHQAFAYITGFCIIAVSAYGYGISWFMLPVLYILLLWYLIRRRHITLKTSIVSIILSFVIVLPLILFAFLLVTDGEQYQIGNITITALTKGRHQVTTIFGSPDILTTLRTYLGSAFKMIILGMDPVPSNAHAIFPFGIFYNMLALPFLCVGLFAALKERNPLNTIFLIWLVSCVFIILFVETNINHWNAVWFPVIYFAGYGIYQFSLKYIPNRVLFFSIFTILFIGFTYFYVTRYTFADLQSQCEKEIKFAQSEGFDTVYYPDNIIHAYILFYVPIDPYLYNTNKTDDGRPLAMVKTFANVKIGLPDNIVPRDKVAYVIPNKELVKLDLSGFNIKKGDYYSVLWSD